MPASRKMYTRFYSIAGITIRLDSALPIGEDTFAPKFKLFEVDGPGSDTINLVHHFSLPQISDFGRCVYHKSPWVIYRTDSRWVYVLETSPDPATKEIRQISIASPDHSRMEIHNGPLGKRAYELGGLGALTMTPTDQILLARLLAERRGCYLHSDGIAMGGKGFLFVGHSGAGKSTIATLLQEKAEILCDDRMIVRKWSEGFIIHGNWSHGTLPIVSANSAPLTAIFFLEKAQENSITANKNRMDNITRLLGCLIKPMVTKDWWESMLALVEDIVDTVPCFRLRFDKSGKIYERLRDM
jgi:hypothetical protein